jgi:hypothetical protein
MCAIRDGKYHTSNNSQNEKSIVAILAIGDSRQLKFHLYSQGRKMEKVHEVEPHVFDMNHGTLFLLHPEDERPFIRSWCKQYGATFFKHSSDGIGTNENATMSLGIAFRVTCHSHEVWKKSGALVLKKEFFPNDHQEYIHGICDAMLQKYVANTKQKSSDEAKIENWWKICENKYFGRI